MPQPPKSVPWMPTRYVSADAYALKACAAGKADSDQQQRAMRWIVEEAAGVYELSYRPEGDRDTAFAEGKRFVGLQVVKLINMPRQLLKSK